MDGIITSFTSLCNQYVSKYVDTGDKIMDNSIICLSSLFLGLIINFIIKLTCSNALYNKILYWYYYVFKGQTEPLSFKTEQYWFDYVANTKFMTASINHDSRELIKIIKKYTHKRSFISSTKPGETCAYLNIKQNSYSSSSYNAMVPLYYDGQDMCFVSCSVLETNNGTIYAPNFIAMCKVLTYLKFKSEQEQTVLEQQSQDKLCIYELSDQIKVSVYAEVKNNFIHIGYVSERKIFNHIYYDQKDHLVNLLNKFQQGELYPARISMDNKLGILLYGPPGTGKTGTICAIANMLGRHILMVDFSKITKRSELDDILKQEFYDKIIYVFDEFDCILDVISNTPNKNIHTKPQTDWTKILEVTQNEERKEIVEMMMDEIKEKQSSVAIDLAYLLQKLDGLEKATNRLIIATTNHPELINPVLLRPGRFDIKLELGNCSQQMYKDILGNFFSDTLDQASIHKQIDKAHLPDKKWSPLKVINTALRTNSLKQTLNYLQQAASLRETFIE